MAEVIIDCPLPGLESAALGHPRFRDASAWEWSSARSARATWPNSLKRLCLMTVVIGGWSVLARTSALLTWAVWWCAECAIGTTDRMHLVAFGMKLSGSRHRRYTRAQEEYIHCTVVAGLIDWCNPSVENLRDRNGTMPLATICFNDPKRLRRIWKLFKSNCWARL